MDLNTKLKSVHFKSDAANSDSGEKNLENRLRLG